MTKRTMLICTLMLRIPLILLIMMVVMIMLFYLYVIDVVFDSHVMFASSSSTHAHGRTRPRRYVHHVVSHAPRNATNGPTMLYHTYDASYVLIFKNDKVVARNLGPKCKGVKTCIWVPKSYVTNLVGPNKSWVPKSQA
jgi:hypothetical protein